ncbi:hypothetical protein A4A49_10815 [Nicotiana attenuata]|uniref:Uncharacterized protein n=1 Tax=Nicotiana attenuata TaxID=49451 RepID=A0A1J6IUF1_NICAT|nr:hypothetical protein A4A49_10815 [Nicotiana attenuata]
MQIHNHWEIPKDSTQIEKIRATVKETVPLKRSVKIGVYDNKNIFIDVYKKRILIQSIVDMLLRWRANRCGLADGRRTSPLKKIFLLLRFGFFCQNFLFTYIPSTISNKF